MKQVGLGAPWYLWKSSQQRFERLTWRDTNAVLAVSVVMSIFAGEHGPTSDGAQ